MRYCKWTASEDEIIRAHTSIADAARALPDRSPDSVSDRARRIGHKWTVPHKPNVAPWTAEEVAILRACSSRREMYARLPHRSPGAVDNAFVRYSNGHNKIDQKPPVERKCLRCQLLARLPRGRFLCEPCRQFANSYQGLI